MQYTICSGVPHQLLYYANRTARHFCNAVYAANSVAHRRMSFHKGHCLYLVKTTAVLFIRQQHELVQADVYMYDRAIRQ